MPRVMDENENVDNQAMAHEANEYIVGPNTLGRPYPPKSLEK
jgi:hypothetical protein